MVQWQGWGGFFRCNRYYIFLFFYPLLIRFIHESGRTENKAKEIERKKKEDIQMHIHIHTCIMHTIQELVYCVCILNTCVRCTGFWIKLKQKENLLPKPKLREVENHQQQNVKRNQFMYDAVAKCVLCEHRASNASCGESRSKENTMIIMNGTWNETTAAYKNTKK